jgi:hypothetical protein
VEPSVALLAKACRSLDAKGFVCQAISSKMEDYAAQSPTKEWDVAQATFSMQCLRPDDRARVWSWLKSRTRQVLVLEFDVPEFDSVFSAGYAGYVLERYERGLREYTDGEQVAQGFLMPVMFGYFDPTSARMNYEQSTQAWRDELTRAGFSQVTSELVDDYWWADARLVRAS